MAATLQSILGDEVQLPHDLLPDDTKLLYENGRILCEIDYDDPDDELAADLRDRKRYLDLALTYYNGMHHTDYKVVTVKEDRSCLHREYSQNSIWIHCGFTAAPSTAVECESAAKHFCAELREKCDGGEVLTCRIVNGLKTTGCKDCDIAMIEPLDRNWDLEFGCDTSAWDKEVNRTKSQEDDPPLSQYSQYLADGVTLSEKAKLRLRYPLLALAYYNKKKHTEYKLVDALPNCASLESSFVIHCNFIARQNAPGDSSNKLFFAELEKRKDDWVVTTCRTLRGKTTAGCHDCPRHQGKRVIHPTRGFRFGLYPEVDRRLRRRC